MLVFGPIVLFEFRSPFQLHLISFFPNFKLVTVSPAELRSGKHSKYITNTIINPKKIQIHHYLVATTAITLYEKLGI